MDAFTGCDSISAFAGKGKAKALKLLMQHQYFVEAFTSLGHYQKNCTTNWKNLQFLWKAIAKRQSFHYQLHCTRAGKVEPDALPP